MYRTDASGQPRFTQTPEPSHAELTAVATKLRDRVVRLLKRRGIIKPGDDVNNEPEQLDALQELTRLAMNPGTRARSGAALSSVDALEVERPQGPLNVVVDGFNLFASAVIPAHDRAGLERVCRYLLRPALSLQRLSIRKDGLVEYRLKKRDKRGNTVLVLDPMEFMARLASLIPAPRHPTRKLWGVLAPAAKDRAKIVPKPTHRKPCHPRSDDEHSPPARPYAQTIPWAVLLARIWGISALDCPRCSATMTPVAVIRDPAEVARYLEHYEEHPPHLARGPPAIAA